MFHEAGEGAGDVGWFVIEFKAESFGSESRAHGSLNMTGANDPV